MTYYLIGSGTYVPNCAEDMHVHSKEVEWICTYTCRDKAMKMVEDFADEGDADFWLVLQWDPERGMTILWFKGLLFDLPYYHIFGNPGIRGRIAQSACKFALENNDSVADVVQPEPWPISEVKNGK